MKSNITSIIQWHDEGTNNEDRNGRPARSQGSIFMLRFTPRSRERAETFTLEPSEFSMEIKGNFQRAQALQETPSAEPVSNTRTPEFDFLLASLRRFFRPESPIPSKEGLDAKAVLELAGRHSVVEFLRCAIDSPAPAQSSVETARSDLALSAELLKLADLFKNEGIDVVPLKGPVLGAALY